MFIETVWNPTHQQRILAIPRLCRSLPSSECSVACAAGFTSSATGNSTSNKLRCPSDAKDGDALVLDFSCTENRCKALELSPGVVPFGTEGCDLRRRLSSHSYSRCQVACASGYEDAGTSWIHCSSSAEENEHVTYSVRGVRARSARTLIISLKHNEYHCITHSHRYIPLSNIIEYY